MKYIDLKLTPPYFQHVEQRLKLFEVRKNDREYEVGDILILNEWLPDEERYTGSWIQREIIYILDDPNYVKEGYVILGID